MYDATGIFLTYFCLIEFLGDFLGKMLNLQNQSSVTLSGEQIEAMDICQLESVIKEVIYS